MAMKFPSPYELKKALMYPRKLYMRRKENLEPGFMLSAMELHYYRPAFYKWLGARAGNEHLLHEASIGADSIVLDVGAYVGDWAMEIMDLYGPTIHAFEPDPRNFRPLEKKAAADERLHAHQFGLGDKNETVTMSMQFLGSSVVMDGEKLGKNKRAEADLKDIVDIWRSLQLERVDLMKINIEGGEFPLLERMMAAGLLGKVDSYVIQFHEWHPGAYSRRRKIHRALQKTHRLVWDYHFVWEKWELK